MEYIFTHGGELIGIFTAIVTVCSLIANLTPTEADNKVVGALVRVVNLLGLNLKKNL